MRASSTCLLSFCYARTHSVCTVCFKRLAQVFSSSLTFQLVMLSLHFTLRCIFGGSELSYKYRN